MKKNIRENVHSVIESLIHKLNLIGDLTEKDLGSQSAGHHLFSAYSHLGHTIDELYLMCKESKYDYPEPENKDSEASQS